MVQREKNQNPHLKRLFRQIPSQNENFPVPRLQRPFRANLKEQKMIHYDRNLREFRFSPILCSCKECLVGNFSMCEEPTVSFLSKKFQTENVIIDENGDEIDDELGENLTFQFADERENVSNPSVSDNISSIGTGNADSSNQLFVECDQTTRNLSSLQAEVSEKEFENGGYYSNFTIERIFEIFYEENERNNSELNVFTYVETALLVNYFETMQPHLALRQCMEKKELKFDKNFLICPIFSTKKMKRNDTLTTSANDTVGHWILLYCDFYSNKGYVLDSLGAANEHVSENAVLDFTKKVFKAFDFFHSIVGNQENEEIILSSIPIQRK